MAGAGRGPHRPPPGRRQRPRRPGREGQVRRRGPGASRRAPLRAGSGVGSSTTLYRSVPETPSTRQWCTLEISAQRPSAALDDPVLPQRPAAVQPGGTSPGSARTVSAVPPGAGQRGLAEVTARSKSASSTHTGAARSNGTVRASAGSAGSAGAGPQQLRELLGRRWGSPKTATEPIASEARLLVLGLQERRVQRCQTFHGNTSERGDRNRAPRLSWRSRRRTRVRGHRPPGPRRGMASVAQEVHLSRHGGRPWLVSPPRARGREGPDRLHEGGQEDAHPAP